MLFHHVVGLRQVNDRQHRKDEGLQGDDENVKDGPTPLQHPSEQPVDDARRKQQRDEHEDHLPRIHVAEESQSQG